MSAQHSPGRLHRNIRPINRYPTLFAGRNTHVAVVVTRGVDLEVAEANAERLLVCWNSHDELIEALRQISLCSQNSASSKDECGRIARAALAEIEEPS